MAKYLPYKNPKTTEELEYLLRRSLRNESKLKDELSAKDKEIAQLDQIITVRNKREKVYREKVRFIEGELETLKERYIHAIPDSR